MKEKDYSNMKWENLMKEKEYRERNFLHFEFALFWALKTLQVVRESEQIKRKVSLIPMFVYNVLLNVLLFISFNFSSGVLKLLFLQAGLMTLLFYFIIKLLDTNLYKRYAFYLDFFNSRKIVDCESITDKNSNKINKKDLVDILIVLELYKEEVNDLIDSTKLNKFLFKELKNRYDLDQDEVLSYIEYITSIILDSTFKEINNADDIDTFLENNGGL